MFQNLPSATRRGIVRVFVSVLFFSPFFFPFFLPSKLFNVSVWHRKREGEEEGGGIKEIAAEISRNRGTRKKHRGVKRKKKKKKERKEKRINEIPRRDVSLFPRSSSASSGVARVENGVKELGGSVGARFNTRALKCPRKTRALECVCCRCPPTGG